MAVLSRDGWQPITLNRKEVTGSGRLVTAKTKPPLRRGRTKEETMEQFEMCKGFCKGPVNNKSGLVCPLNTMQSHIFETKKRFHHSPKTQEATHNVIKNGGRDGLCLNNPWRYDEVQ